MSNAIRSDINYYETLEISPTATQAQVKQAYRQLAKQFHPDGQNSEATHDKIAQLNAAYEVLGDESERQRYDALRNGPGSRLGDGQRNSQRRSPADNSRTSRAATAQSQYHRRSAATKTTVEITIDQWLRSVYTPTDRLIGQIIKPLKAEIRALSADPFDDELMAVFQTYLETCRASLEKAQTKFKSMPNPAGVASGAANVYYCLNQLEDGIEELERFTYTYDDSYLHTGQELFRISAGLKKEAKAEIKAVL